MHKDASPGHLRSVLEAIRDRHAPRTAIPEEGPGVELYDIDGTEHRRGRIITQGASRVWLQFETWDPSPVGVLRRGHYREWCDLADLRPHEPDGTAGRPPTSEPEPDELPELPPREDPPWVAEENARALEHMKRTYAARLVAETRAPPPEPGKWDADAYLRRTRGDYTAALPPNPEGAGP